MFWIFIGLIALTAIYYYLKKHYNYWTERGVKQTSPVWIAGDNWGQLIQTQSPTDMVYEIYNSCPNTRYSGMYQFLIPTLVLKDPNLIKQITVKDFEYFLDHRPFIPPEADPFFASNLFALTGQKWKDMRSTISPVFTSSKMKIMFALMSESAENFVNYFFNNKKEDIITVEMKDILTRYSNDVIATTVFGIKCDSLEEPNNEFYMRGKNVSNFAGLWKTFKFFTFLLIPKIAIFFKMGFVDRSEQKFFLNLVKQTIKTRQEQGIIRPDFINLMMEARKTGLKYEENKDNIDTGFATTKESEIGKAQKVQKYEITDVNITGQALTFFFAGFDTVSSVMCFLSYELGVNPEISKRLQEEIDETLESCSGKLTYEALLKMKYLDMVVCETLRKWPNVVGIDRVCTKDYTIQPTSPDEKPVHLKKDDVLILPIFGLHRDPNYFPDPEKFDPERFSDENKHKIVPYTYIPFGSGPRNCIGSRFAILETKILMFYLLSKFDIVPVEKTQIPLKLSKKQLSVTAENGFWLGLKRRYIK